MGFVIARDSLKALGSAKRQARCWLPERTLEHQISLAGVLNGAQVFGSVASRLIYI